MKQKTRLFVRKEPDMTVKGQDSYVVTKAFNLVEPAPRTRLSKSEVQDLIDAGTEVTIE